MEIKDQPYSCSCKGIRTCKLCEDSKSSKLPVHEVIQIKLDEIAEIALNSQNISYLLNKSKLINYVIPLMTKDEKIPSEQISQLLNIIFPTSYAFEGFTVNESVLNHNEEQNLLTQINDENWQDSQSGRKKQDYGPKINYKKKKISYSKLFFPKYLNILQGLLSKIPLLDGFIVREIGNLKYDQSLGSHIEPHVDHTWVWGRRIVGLNLISATIMTFSFEVEIGAETYVLELNIPIPSNAIYVMSASARYRWKHAVKKEFITGERIVVTMREFDEEFYNSNKEEIIKYYKN